jgi:flagellar biosynthesis protein FlhG
MTSEPKGARRYAVISGKGGVGKTVITANLAAAFAASGKRTLVLDADLGLANLDLIVGISPERTLHDVIRGTADVANVIVRTAGGFDLLPAGSGFVEGTLITPAMAETVKALLDMLDADYDTIFFDAGAGIGEVVLFFARLAHEVLLVVTPEPTSIMDAYATIKIMARLYQKTQFGLIVNLANPSRPAQTGTAVARHLQQVISKFLVTGGQAEVCLNLIGSIPRDPAVSLAVSKQQLLMNADPSAPSALCMQELAQALILCAPS